MELNEAETKEYFITLEFHIESLIGIIETNEKLVCDFRQSFKLNDNKDFFREFITLESKIIEIIQKLAISKYANKEDLNVLIEKYKFITINYQGNWKESYWLMYNSTRNETDELSSFSENELVFNEDDLKDIDNYIDNLHADAITSSCKEKDRSCGCAIF